MASEYRLDIHTAVGVKRAEVTDYLTLAYTRRVNAPGLLTFSLPGSHSSLPLEDGAQIVVHRRNPTTGLPWGADFWGLFRAEDRRYTDRDLFTARCPGVLSLLGRRIVAWRAGTVNRSEFSAVRAETIMKTLVNHNAGSAATTANGRVRDGQIAGYTLAVEADGARGAILSLGCAWDNLLEALQKLAAVGGGDFDLLRTGATSLEFRWYTGQRGTDRSVTLLFALDRGNMAAPQYRHDRIEERTVAVVGGAGDGTARVAVVRTGTDWASANDSEVFVDARHSGDAATLQAAGDARLQERRARREFDFGVVQTTSCYYGLHYGLGDLVRAQYGAVNTLQKIVGVSISLDRTGQEQIDIEMETQ